MREIRLRNYKSIAKCRVELTPLTLIVGRNGSGKSNFLDAFRFVADALDTSLDHALKSRGGIEEVRRRSTGHPWDFAIELSVGLSGGNTARYGFEIGTQRGSHKKGRTFVKTEQLSIASSSGTKLASFRVEAGETVSASLDTLPRTLDDRLLLVAASSIPVFREVFDALRTMGFYNLNPESMKELQSPDAGELLHRDGANIASVVARLERDRPSIMERVRQYLVAITPGITEVNRVALGPKETLEFRQMVAGATHPWKFYAANMSDGTLRALGVLVAVSQLAGRSEPVRLVGIEEPETALHPAAAGALMDALLEAGQHTQTLVTTHSPDLLDTQGLSPHSVFVVVSEEGATSVAPVDAASVNAVQKHLYGLAELHRMEQLQPDRENIRRQQQFSMFE